MDSEGITKKIVKSKGRYYTYYYKTQRVDESGKPIKKEFIGSEQIAPRIKKLQQY